MPECYQNCAPASVQRRRQFRQGVEQVRQKVTIDFVRDRDLEEPLEPLMVRAVQSLVSLEGEARTFGVTEEAAGAEQRHASCLPSEYAGSARRGERNVYTDEFGQRFAAHFIVPPFARELRVFGT